MKTVYGSLVVMCLLAVMLCVPNSAVSAGHDAAAILTTLDPGDTFYEDADVTEGAGFSFSFRPTRLVRLHVGGTHNGIRPGARAGLAGGAGG